MDTHTGPADDDFPEGFDPKVLDDELERLLRESAGPAQPPPPAAPAAVPPPPAAPRPAPVPVPEPERVPVAPEPVAPAPAPVVAERPSAAEWPELPQPAIPEYHRPMPKEPTAPNYWGSRGLVVVYWIAILTGAIGQVIFFGELFNMGWPGYVAAAVIATTAETIMVSAGDTALAKRSQGRRKTQWIPFLLIAFTAAAAASGMNLTHWWEKNISMAIIFGGIAFLGFLLHVIHGFGDGTQFLEDQAAYDKAVEEHNNKIEAEHLARRRAAERLMREAAKPAPAARPEVAAAAAPKPTAVKAAAEPGKAAPADAAGTAVVKEVAIPLGIEHQATTPKALKELLVAKGHILPSDSTIKNWCREIKDVVSTSR